MCVRETWPVACLLRFVAVALWRRGCGVGLLLWWLGRGAGGCWLSGGAAAWGGGGGFGRARAGLVGWAGGRGRGRGCVMGLVRARWRGCLLTHPRRSGAARRRAEADDDRSVVPGRVFGTRGPANAIEGGVAALRPRHLPAAGDPAAPHSAQGPVPGTRRRRGAPKVSELRQQWADTTIAENPREFARFVIRRAILAIERVELRLLGPEYKSPRLIKPEILDSARFREGLEQIPGATIEKAGEMLDELSTGWSRFSVDLMPSLGRAIFSRGFDPTSTTTAPRSR